MDTPARTFAAGSGDTEPTAMEIEHAVRTRYSAASHDAEPCLCCPVTYDPRYLEVLPPELIERDYGCGDPSRFVQPGEHVLDLGSGGGKICYIASQIVGPEGRVIGVDMNADMLALARKHQAAVAQAIGWDNVQFHRGRIQDLGLDLDRLENYLAQHPIRSSGDWLDVQSWSARQREEAPMVASDSIDVVISNCVLNLVRPDDRRQLFDEMFRVLRRGGRATISDIVSDEPIPERLRRDPKLWSGCISGAFVEHEFLEAFERAGFYGIEFLDYQAEPWAVVEGIEFRSVTVRAYKGKEGPCLDRRQAVIYRGPWRSVTDDDGHVLRRGVRTAVCEKTYQIYSSGPYAEQFVAVPPAREVPRAQATPFDCRRNSVREPRETKAGQTPSTLLPVTDCQGPNCC